MVSVKTILSLGLIAVANASSDNPGCGEVNVLYTGLPAYHPMVVDQGWDPDMVDANLRAEAQQLIDAGYNTRLVLVGPEEDLGRLEARMQDVQFDVTGIGYGVRPTKIPTLITRFEDLNFLFRKMVPNTPTVYNYSPGTLLWSVERRFPLAENCTGRPGRDLGYEEICDERCELSRTAWNLRKASLNKDSNYLASAQMIMGS